ncbi:MAG: metallophosphoesterase [Alphaproteobacteria bacterium]|nr:metallophosphoesterase [Alphaproteobacteria bacterium]
MRIVHLSDLHFGTEFGNIVPELEDVLQQIKPGLIVMSGDFTQIGSRTEFARAENFIKNMPTPVFCVPGNHDIPRYHILQRFFAPYKRYRKFISNTLGPVYTDDNLIMAGINTARRVLPHWNWAHGAVSSKQLHFLDEAFKGEKDKFRICVMHHPLQKAEKVPLKVTVFGVKKAMRKIHDLKIDLVLTGHVHHASITVVEDTVFASASTATSFRHRVQDNGFNVIDLAGDYSEISHYGHQENAFVLLSTHKHKKKM